MAMTTRYTVIDGEVIAEKRNGVRSLYVPDSSGSTVALLDNTQTVTDTFSYWPYGEEANRTGTTPTPLRFVGTQGYYRNSPNSVYADGKYLNVSSTRWIDEDAYELELGEDNMYRYARNNPITYTNHAKPPPIHIGPVPPGQSLKPGHIGDTGCNAELGKPGAGKCYSIYVSSRCYTECLEVHEAQHRYDQKKCCQGLVACLRSSSKPLHQILCYNAYFAWSRANDAWLECQAYKNELECEEQMMRQKDCWRNPTDPCCASLIKRRETVSKRIRQYCGPTRWPRKGHTECQYPK